MDNHKYKSSKSNRRTAFMKAKIFTFCSRTALISMEIAAVILGLGFLAASLLIWRLLSGPVDVGFAKNYIEQALHDPVSGYSVTLDDVVVEWPDWRGPLMLEIDGVGLVKNNNPILEIEDVSLGLASRYLFIGDIKPVSITLNSPAVNLIRTAENEITLSLDDDAPETEPEEDDSDPVMNIINTLSAAPDQIDNRSPLAKLQSVNINNAKAVVADHKLGITWFLSPLDLTFAKAPEGMIITSHITLPGGRDRASNIQSDLVYLREKKEFIANIHVQDFDPHIISNKIDELSWMNDHYAIFNGNVELGFNQNFEINKVGVSLSSVNGEVLLKDVYDDPLPFEELFIDAVYDKKAGIAELESLSLRSKGVAINISSPLKITDDSFAGPVNISIPELAQKQISPLWPDALRGEGAEIWLTQKLSNGSFKEIEASFDFTGKKDNDTWEVDVDQIVANFDIETMDIDYRAPLLPVASANGKGNFSDDTLNITIASGKLGDIDVKKGDVKLDNIIAGKGNAYINIDLDGPLQSVFRYIQPEPIGMSEEKLGLKVADVKGNAKLNVDVSFPTKRNLLSEEVKVKAEGTLHEVLLPDVVKSLDLSGGPFNISVKDGAASLDGKGKLDGRPIDFTWKEFVDPEGKEFSSRVTAKVNADKNLRDILGIGLTDWIEGTFPVDVTYTQYSGGRSQADVKADLGPGQVFIGPMNYAKPIGTAGTATCAVIFRNGAVTEVRDLDVKTDKMRLNNGRFYFENRAGKTELTRGALPEFILEENDLKIDIDVATNGLLKLAVTGPFLDARPFLGDKKKSKEQYDGPPLLVSVSVDRMRTHPARMVDQAKIYLDMNRQGDIDQFEMDAVAGKGDIYVRLKPNEKGLMSIRLEADDAGAMLKAFNIYENARGGKIKIYGEAKSPQERKILFGKAEMTDFYVVNAPALAQLLNAISLFGIQQLLGGEGIYFSRLETDFQWQMLREGDAYFFDEGRTSGSSLGLTFKGRIDKGADMIGIEGTIVPVSFVNEIIGSIPLIGDILTGGGGGIIAATYKFEGPVKEPKVSVNPLSALAPGILRTILFE